jgi:2-keto-4-pentenoate hydratase/2-oxohepta-3-ene-1,7-dioic acid hydratase in catechol pathway
VYRLATYQGKTGPRAGIVAGGSIFDAAEAAGESAYRTVLDILADWPRSNDRIATRVAGGLSGGWPVQDAHLRAPVLWPSAIYCAGANYRDHAIEMARSLNRPHDPNAKRGQPWHFLKSTRCVTDPGAIVAAAHYSAKLDWEVELAAVIGKPAKNVSPENALDHVAGYTVANDLSARDLGRRPDVDPRSPFAHDWTGQKCFDGSCPLGPWIVPAGEIADPQNLGLRLWVNDVLKQDSNTREMIFSVAEQIAHLSRGMTLYPGDVILTGTPAGVGVARGEFLKAGDSVRVEIEQIGTLTNTIA